ncbi:MAG: hypothetical protein EX254_10650 [Flavobacteriaceae bacterium]|nr:MAG: hypothetical protein EX254_10650 [Flavobacteriaceae bacterium]
MYALFCSSSFGQELSLKINGKTELESKIIDSLDYERRFRDFKELIKEKDKVKTQLFKLGFIENREISSNKSNDSTYLVSFSLNTRFKSIDIYYSKEIVSRKMISTISEDVYDDYFSIPFHSVESKLEFINTQLANQGTPFRTLQLMNIERKTDDTLKADLIVSEESIRTIDKIVVNGYEKFPRSFLKRYLKINRNEEFNLTEVKTKTEELNELTFASQIKSPEVLFTKDSTTLYIYLEKRTSNTFDGFLGFGTNETTNKIEFDGYLNLNLINNLNFGETLQLRYKSDEIDQKTFNAQVELPYLFGSPIGTQLELNIFKKDSSFSTTNQIAKIFYQLNSKSKVYGGISSTQSNDLLNGMSTTLFDDYDSLFYNLSFSYVSREKFEELFPINFFFDSEIGFGNRTVNDLRMNQSNIIFDTYKIFNLNQTNSIYLRSNGSFLFSDDYLFNELFRFGGINSIRGFEENSLFASLYALLNTEYRHKLSNNIYINSIIDAAYYENDLQGIKEKLFGFGFGIGILTNSGLLKLNYANGKNENQKFNISNSKVHISLKATF